MIEPPTHQDLSNINQDRAVEIIRLLADHIGPRPAGSLDERLAQDRLADFLHGWGYTTERMPARFVPPSFFTPNYSLAALGFVVAAMLLPIFP